MVTNDNAAFCVSDAAHANSPDYIDLSHLFQSIPPPLIHH